MSLRSVLLGAASLLLACTSTLRTAGVEHAPLPVDAEIRVYIHEYAPVEIVRAVGADAMRLRPPGGQVIGAVRAEGSLAGALADAKAEARKLGGRSLWILPTSITGLGTRIVARVHR
jgi:hypothetical protein